MEKEIKTKEFTEFVGEAGYVQVEKPDSNYNYLDINTINLYDTPENVVKFFKQLAKEIKKNYCKE
jgi:hypothetical protein